MNKTLAQELIGMLHQDEKNRERLVEQGTLSDGYDSEMECVLLK